MELCAYLYSVVMPYSFLFGASTHPYIPLHFEEMIFALVYYSTGESNVSSPCKCIVHCVHVKKRPISFRSTQDIIVRVYLVTIFQFDNVPFHLCFVRFCVV